MGPLTESKIRASKATDKPFKVSDERGLFLLVNPTGSRLWRFKYRIGGKEKLLALGAYPEVPLALARQRREDARRLVAAGVDPSVERRASKAAAADSFKAVALEWLALRQTKLSASSYDKALWMFEKLLFPFVGSKPIGGITAPEILTALRKTEARGRNESAHRAKQKASQVFRYAIATGRAERDPTADLRGALAPVVTKNRAAVTDPARIGDLMRALHGYKGQPGTEVALKLAPLLFVRPGELRMAKWEEFDLDGPSPEWRIPAERTKMRTLHIVPLAVQAVNLLKDLQPVTGPDGYLFPSLRSGARSISENTINAALRRLGYSKDEMTGHGFRAMASTALNELGFPPDDIELQLAHVERNKVRAAYNRSKRIAERRTLMQQWADYLDGLRAGASVVPFRKGA